MKDYNNAFCRICGSEYHRCNCSSEESWRKVTDTAEHYQIFCIVRDYVNEIINADKANSLLGKLDLTGSESFRPNIKEVLAEIKSKAKPPQIKSDITNNVKANNKKNVKWNKK